ncbi:hypothetical protein [Streptomyces cyaneofuscatus]|uniref:hypothetical protein n=1 Tax=Streptomyces cyaneofuscatus TaxID=66883 RepID=UPI0037B82350
MRSVVQRDRIPVIGIGDSAPVDDDGPGRHGQARRGGHDGGLDALGLVGVEAVQPQRLRLTADRYGLVRVDHIAVRRQPPIERERSDAPPDQVAQLLLAHGRVVTLDVDHQGRVPVRVDELDPEIREDLHLFGEDRGGRAFPVPLDEPVSHG